MTSLPPMLLDDHVVAEDGVAVRPAGAGLRGLVEVHLGDLTRLARVGDVEDVDVGLLQVVDEHDVPAAVAPALCHANAECVWLAFVCGTPLAARRPSS